VEAARGAGRRAHLREDLVAAGLWTLAVVPSALGFWLVAGSLAGVTPDRVHALIVGSMLGLAFATLLQVLLGFRLPMYEGPASAYLAAITVVTANGAHGLDAISGGLLAAGVGVALMALLRVDRLMARAFTPLVANVFVLTVTLAVIPATYERAIGATDGLPGDGAAWASTLAVVGAVLFLRRRPRWSPYSLLVALLAGTGVHLLLDGVPSVDTSGGLQAPVLFPWGSPDVGVAVVLPFLVAGALAAFNTIASGRVVALEHALVSRGDASGRAFLMHGAAQAGGAVVGNVVGTVSRLDSIGIARLLGNPRRRPLVLAAMLIGAVAFVGPIVEITAALPLSVSAALLAVVLTMILLQTLRSTATEPVWMLALVVAPSLVPSIVWIAIGSSLSPVAQLVANPMLWGVVLAVVLERAVPSLRGRARARPQSIRRRQGAGDR
jgi:xanthine/uracil permease